MIDNDIIVDPYALNELMKIISKSSKIGITSSVNYYYDNPEEVHYIGNTLNWRTWIFHHVTLKEVSQSNAYIIDCASNSSLLIKKQVVNEIGMIDPDYFCYFNDSDWCIRAKKAGYLTCTVINSRVWHKVSKTTKTITGFKVYYSMRNMIILIKKNASFSKYCFFLIYLLTYYFPREILSVVSQKQLNILKFLSKGLKDGLVFT